MKQSPQDSGSPPPTLCMGAEAGETGKAGPGAGTPSCGASLSSVRWNPNGTVPSLCGGHCRHLQSLVSGKFGL